MSAAAVTPRVLQAATLVSNRPGISRAEVAASLGCALRTAGAHLSAAQAAGLVRVDGCGRYARWHPVSRMAVHLRVDRVPSCIWDLGAMA